MGARTIWEPAHDAWAASRLADFAGHVADTGGPRCHDYRGLLRWSLDDPGAFWSALARWGGVRWHSEPTRALGSTAMPGAEWFTGATLNYAECALAHATASGGDPALIAISQTRERIELSWTQLVDRVARCRAGLTALGVGRGDRVVAFLPTIPETTVAFLAVASLGAIWSTCAPEFGVRAVIDRWQQIEPKVLFTIDGYLHGDRRIDRAGHVAAIIDGLPTLEAVIRLPYLDPTGPDDWSGLLATPPANSIQFEAVPFDHPLYILFSSGTTGLPKPIVHGHGGITVEHIKALALHYDLRPGDRFSWFTTTGWMMWNFLASTSLVGATTVLFDGDPGWPDLSALWTLAAAEHLDVLGVSAPFIMACRKAGLRPRVHLDLSDLRHVGSTGAPLAPEGFEWVSQAVGAHVQLGSLSGGTDVCTGFLGPAPTLPVKVGELTTRMLGCDIRSFRPDGSECEPGETGELVIAQPMPSMPVGFWGDDDGHRYRDAYFSDFPGVWRHGDWITFDADGGSVISGRSDATLNRGGVRLGTSDFYTVVEARSDIADSLVVHLEDPDGDGPGELILFVATSTPDGLDDTLRDELRRSLRSELSPRHVPDLIVEIPSVPRTLSGKKLEVPVKRLLLGAPVDDVASRDSLADPTSLEPIVRWLSTRRH